MFSETILANIADGFDAICRGQAKPVQDLTDKHERFPAYSIALDSRTNTCYIAYALLAGTDDTILPIANDCGTIRRIFGGPRGLSFTDWYIFNPDIRAETAKDRLYNIVMYILLHNAMCDPSEKIKLIYKQNMPAPSLDTEPTEITKLAIAAFQSGNYALKKVN